MLLPWPGDVRWRDVLELLQPIWDFYGELGWHAAPQMSPDVAENFRHLIRLGFDRHLLRGVPKR